MKSNPEVEKEKNEFEFMVYLHLLGHSIVIFIILIFAFQNAFFNTLLKENNIIFYTILVILFATTNSSIYTPILKNKPMNYIYLFIFTLCISYIFCKIAILFNFYFTMIMCFFNISKIICLTIKSYSIKNNKKIKNFFINHSFTFYIFLIGSILCRFYKIGTLKYFIILINFLIFDFYINRSMDYILKRNNFKNTDYISTVIFLYINIFRLILKLLKKLYNSYQSEKEPNEGGPVEKEPNEKNQNAKKPIRSNGSGIFKRKFRERGEKDENQNEKSINEKKPIRKNLIYTGEEDFRKYYETDKDQNEKNINEKKPIRKNLIYTGEEDFREYYKKDEDQNEKIPKEVKKILNLNNNCNAIKECDEDEDESASNEGENKDIKQKNEDELNEDLGDN